MAYMHKKTFDIYAEVHDIQNPDDYFVVDDLIALPIQILNRKGYTTKFCCVGHPFLRYFQDEIIQLSPSDPMQIKREYGKMSCRVISYLMKGLFRCRKCQVNFIKTPVYQNTT